MSGGAAHDDGETRAERGAGVAAARWMALGVVLCAAGIRCLAQHSAFPYWDLDPTILAVPQGGLTPRTMAVLDLATLVAAGVLLWRGRESAGRSGLGVVEAMLLAAGLAAIVWHVVRTDARSLEAWALGLTWAAAWVGAMAVRAACVEVALRRAAVAALMPLVLVLVMKGVLQITVEHAETLRGFQADRGAFLAAQGWSADSEMARGFERRLMQPEASGWFGLANVFAAFSATGAVFFAWMAAGVYRAGLKRSGGMMAALIAMAGACGAGVWMAGSKQGYAAVLVGLAMPMALGVGAWVWRGLPGWMMVGVPMGVLVIVVVRGVLGDHLSELSLRFRWFYLEGAARIFLSEPWAGVGPGGFKDAYLIQKNPLSPEEVSSPHSLIFDLAATLGLGGIALAGVWLRWVRDSVGRLGDERGAASTEEVGGVAGAAGRCVLYTVLGATVAAAAMDSMVTTPEAALLRVLGLAAWVGGGFVLLRTMRGGVELVKPGVAAAAALAFSASLDLAPVQASSAAWVCAVFALIAAAAGGGTRRTPRDVVRSDGPRPRARVGEWIALGATTAALLMGGWVTAHVWRWESLLRRAAEEVRATTTLRLRLVDLSRGRTFVPGDTLEAWREDLAGRFAESAEGRTLVDALARARGWTELDRLLISEERGAWERGAEILSRATATPTTAQALSRLELRVADAWVLDGDEAARKNAAGYFAMAYETAERSLDVATMQAWRATVLESIAQVRAREVGGGRTWVEPRGLGDLESLRAEALLRAIELDPWNPQHPAKLARLREAGGQMEEAWRWAALALVLDERRRLDPLRRFLPAERAALERLADRTDAPGAGRAGGNVGP